MAEQGPKNLKGVRLELGDVGHRPRPERIAVFNWARAGRQKIVYAINDALGDASGEALAIMLRAAGGDDLSLDDFFGGEARNPLRGQSPP